MWEIIGALGYVAAMTWITMFAPQEAKVATFAILHGAILVMIQLGYRPDAGRPGGR